MANQINSNPIVIDTTNTTVIASGATTRSLRLIQWVDDDANIANASTLGITINGVSLTFTAAMETTANYGQVPLVAWQVGPFNPGINVSHLVVDDMAEGNIHIWFN